MEEMDDFGDLYADVEVHVNAGVGNFDELYAEEEEKNGRDLDISEKKETEADSVCRDNNVNEDVERLVGSEAELPGLEADNENVITENVSDSEDDLHIVLNEEDCRMFPTSRVRSSLNREFGAGSDDEDEDDDLVIVTETAGLNNVQLSADGLDESNGSTIAERGNTLKAGYLSQYSQFKDNLRQQTTMQTKIPVYESSRPSQAYEAEFLQKTAAPEIPPDEITQVLLGERISSVTESVDFAARSSEIPRGRAILVEGGTGERMPSMDARRPRLRDSDVVIQIAVQDCVEDSSVLGKDEIKRIDETLLDPLKTLIFEDNPSMECFGSCNGNRQPTDCFNGYSRDPLGSGLGIDIASSYADIKSSAAIGYYRNSEPKAECASSYLDNDHHRDRVTDLEKQNSKKAKEPIPEENCKALEASCGSKEAGSGYTIKSDKEADLSSDSGTLQSLSPPNVKRNSGEPKVEIPSTVKTDNHMTRQTSSSVTGQQEPLMSESDHSNDSKSVTSKTDEEKRKNYKKRHPIQGEHNHCSRARLRSVAESKNQSNGGGGSPQASQKGRQHRAHLWCETREKKQHNYDTNEEEDLTHYRRTKKYLGFHGRGSTGKQTERNAHTELFHRNYDLQSRERMRSFIRRSQDEWKYIHERGENEITDRESYCRDRVASSVAFKDSKLSPLRKTFYPRGEGYMLSERRVGNVRCRGKRAGDDLFELEYRYREEFFEEKSGRDEPYYDREEPFQEKYRRQIPCYGREEKSIHDKSTRRVSHFRRELPERQERCGHSLHFDADHSPSSADGNRHWRHPDGWPWSPQTIREFHTDDGREWWDDGPRHHIYGPRRSDGRHEDHWRPNNFLELHPKKTIGDNFISVSDEYHYPSHDNDYYFVRSDDDSSGCRVYHKDIVYNERKRYSWQSKAADWSDYQARIEYQDEHSSYNPIVRDQCERNSRDRHDHLDHSFVSDGGKPSTKYYLDRKKSNAIEEESRYSEVRKQIHAVSDIDGIKVEATITNCRESVDLHLNDWEGKLLELDACLKNTLFHVVALEKFLKAFVACCPDNKHLRLYTKPTQLKMIYAKLFHAALRYIKFDGRLVYKSDFGRVATHPRRSSRNGYTRYDRHGPPNLLADKESVLFRNPSNSRTGKEISSSPPKMNVRPCSISSKIERLGPCISDRLIDHSDEKWLDKYPIVQDQEGQMLEEGQLVPEEPESEEAGAGKRKWHTEKITPTSAVQMKKPCRENAMNDNKVVEKYDNGRILETLAKMEKRRERFKEPIAPKKEPDKSNKPLTEPVLETAEIQAQRPSRKRRWGGS
ncbi:hypothetical protein ACLOJK_026522 [Asimina triloba]